jgi:hypothetical protein
LLLLLLFFDDVDRYCSLTFNPFVLNVMLFFSVQDVYNRLNRCVSHETETSWFVCLLVLQYQAVFYLAKLLKVGSKLLISQVVRQSSHKDLSLLCLFVIRIAALCILTLRTGYYLIESWCLWERIHFSVFLGFVRVTLMLILGVKWYAGRRRLVLGSLTFLIGLLTVHTALSP